jgi:hypothetical protein
MAPPLPEPLSPLRPFRPNNLSRAQADDLGPALSPMPSQAPDAFPHSNWDRNTPSPRPRGLSSQQSTTASLYEMMDDDMEQQHPRLAGLSAINLDDRCVCVVGMYMQRRHHPFPPAINGEPLTRQTGSETQVTVLSQHTP